MAHVFLVFAKHHILHHFTMCKIFLQLEIASCRDLTSIKFKASRIQLQCQKSIPELFRCRISQKGPQRDPKCQIAQFGPKGSLQNENAGECFAPLHHVWNLAATYICELPRADIDHLGHLVLNCNGEKAYQNCCALSFQNLTKSSSMWPEMSDCPILPEGLTTIRKCRRVLRTTSLHVKF